MNKKIIALFVSLMVFTACNSNVTDTEVKISEDLKTGSDTQDMQENIDDSNAEIEASIISPDTESPMKEIMRNNDSELESIEISE
ncbi:hypothetical protein GW846_00235 [Candidatus Gracilibacteria bacterium]|nr:hypothetical protein [Candidatus Gracilibacteria bacterium]